MALEPVFDDSSNWGLVWEDSRQANIINSTPPSHDPIPQVVIPVIMQVFTVAILTQTVNPKPRWKFGGNASALVQTGLVQGGIFESAIATQYLRLGTITICRFPQLASSYKLVIDVPIWFKAFSYSVWAYSGEGIADVEGKLDYVSNQIQNLGV